MTGTLLAGDTALVTGAAAGIGRGIAQVLAREGARVILADADAGRGREVETQLRADGLAARFVVADLARVDGPEALLAAARTGPGPLTILVHAASPPRPEAETVLGVGSEAWDRMLAVNLRAGFELGRGAGRQMREAGVRGRMVFITSLHAGTPRNLPHYSAAKAGLTMVVKELARAFGPDGIRVNAVAPGAIPGGGSIIDPDVLGRVPLGRPGTAADIAGMTLALLVERFSAYVTGTTVVVDGGLSLSNWIPPRT